MAQLNSLLSFSASSTCHSGNAKASPTVAKKFSAASGSVSPPKP